VFWVFDVTLLLFDNPPTMNEALRFWVLCCSGLNFLVIENDLCNMVEGGERLESLLLCLLLVLEYIFFFKYFLFLEREDDFVVDFLR
jgi:hypothetical protein